MDIIINRDSVCPGEDIESHERTYQMDNNSTYEDLFKVLMDDNYFPSISGNNAVGTDLKKGRVHIFIFHKNASDDTGII